MYMYEDVQMPKNINIFSIIQHTFASLQYHFELSSERVFIKED